MKNVYKNKEAYLYYLSPLSPKKLIYTTFWKLREPENDREKFYNTIF